MSIMKVTKRWPKKEATQSLNNYVAFQPK